ncbi:MAG: mannose-6-phosphate isomerase, class I [Treponema sp.]|jgi:mannose-6-phosphate isomerase|nr:mannose-6-phosphate isomerase, class I [Treponema sp.]
MPDSKLRIDVLGTSVTIVSPESPEYLSKLLERLQSKIEETQKVTGLNDALKIAVLTGFSLCDDIEKIKSEKNNDSRELESLALNLISRLDEVFESGNARNPRKNGKIHKLANAVKNYPWGSPDWIPALLGEANPSRVPWAELWMGVHPEGPSRAGGTLLSSLIEEEPLFYLGEDAEKNFGDLPFVFKVLAALKPLSIQAHPNLEQAREGWERENREGIAFDAPGRNYKDPNHKPEIICALSPFKAMGGFRKTEDIQTLLGAFFKNAPVSLEPVFNRLDSALSGKDGYPLKAFFRSLFDMNEDEQSALSGYAVSGKCGAEYPQYSKELELVSRLAELYPKDPAVIAPLYLNLIELEPGEAIYLPSGILHAYIHGLAIELMANSDNVLRGGLTSKHIDKEELFRILNFNPFKPSVLEAYPEENFASDGSDFIETPDLFEPADLIKSDDKAGAPGFSYTYPVFCSDFSLTLLHGGALTYASSGPLIIIVTSGELAIACAEQKLTLRKGESAFVPAGLAARKLKLSGNFTAYAAGTGAAL